MPRTFSLRRLLIGITLFCLICGFVANYSHAALAIAYFGCLPLPTLLVWLGLRYFSRDHVSLAIAVGVGALTVSCGPVLYSGPALTELSEYFKFILLPLAIPMAVGALITGVAKIVFESFTLK